VAPASGAAPPDSAAVLPPGMEASVEYRGMDSGELGLLPPRAARAVDRRPSGRRGRGDSDPVAEAATSFDAGNRGRVRDEERKGDEGARTVSVGTTVGVHPAAVTDSASRAAVGIASKVVDAAFPPWSSSGGVGQRSRASDTARGVSSRE
jgi:hypothetical protein